MNPLLLRSGRSLARGIADGELSSRDVLEASIARVERVNPALNAVVRTRYDEARREADAADARVKSGDTSLPPFHGVPCSIKECFALTGMPNTSGLVSRANLPAKSDATAVARMRAAGAIPVGVTNTSELCMWHESNNRLYGRTNNPYDVRRSVGGSSGGEGAIVGSGAVPFGLGSDIGGSIRMPAFFNGVFGHKPSGGLVPGTGQFPMAHGAARRFLTTGPITRRAEDLYPLLDVLRGPDGFDTEVRDYEKVNPADVSLATLTVIDVAGNGSIPVAPELMNAQRRAAEHLATRVATVKVRTFARLARSLELWAAALKTAELGAPTFGELLGGGVRIEPLRELGRLALRRSKHTLPALILAVVEQLPQLTGTRARAAITELDALRTELDDAIGTNGVMLYPSYSRTAARHYATLLQPFHFPYTAILNVLGYAVTQVPLGLSSTGMPLGVQVVAPAGCDHVTIAVALELERAFGGWVPPPALA